MFMLCGTVTWIFSISTEPYLEWFEMFAFFTNFSMLNGKRENKIRHELFFFYNKMSVLYMNNNSIY